MKTTQISWSRLCSLLAIVLTIGVSCDPEDEPVVVPVEPEEPVVVEPTTTVWVVNQGSFQNTLGSIDAYYPDSSKYVRGVYEQVNGEALPGNVQSLRWFNDTVGVVVTNRLDAVVILDKNVKETERLVNGDWLTTPRYAAENEDYLFISVWGPYADPANGDYSLNESTIAVLDRDTYTLVTEIPVAGGPEYLEVVDDNLWVGHATWATKQLTVVDIPTMEVEKNIPLAVGSPQVVAGGNNDVWAYNGTLVIRFDNETLADAGYVELLESVNGLYKAESDTLYVGTTLDNGKANIFQIDLTTSTYTAQKVMETEGYLSFLYDENRTAGYFANGPASTSGTFRRINSDGTSEDHETGIYPALLVKTSF